MSPALAVEICIQKSTIDCVMACLAMILGVPYVDVVHAAAKVDPTLIRTGCTYPETRRVAKTLGRDLRYADHTQLDEATGILFHTRGRSMKYHAVVMFNGSLIDPSSGLIYLPEAYFAANPTFKPARLMVLGE